MASSGSVRPPIVGLFIVVFSRLFCHPFLSFMKWLAGLVTWDCEKLSIGFSIETPEVSTMCPAALRTFLSLPGGQLVFG